MFITYTYIITNVCTEKKTYVDNCIYIYMYVCVLMYMYEYVYI